MSGRGLRLGRVVPRARLLKCAPRADRTDLLRRLRKSAARRSPSRELVPPRRPRHRLGACATLGRHGLGACAGGENTRLYSSPRGAGLRAPVGGEFGGSGVWGLICRAKLYAELRAQRWRSAFVRTKAGMGELIDPAAVLQEIPAQFAGILSRDRSWPAYDQAWNDYPARLNETPSPIASRRCLVI